MDVISAPRSYKMIVDYQEVLLIRAALQAHVGTLQGEYTKLLRQNEPHIVEGYKKDIETVNQMIDELSWIE